MCPHPSSCVTENRKVGVGLGEGTKEEEVKPASHGRLKPSEGRAGSGYLSLLLA